MLLDDALRATEVVRSLDGPIVDVGSGGGSPGIPLAVVLPERDMTLLEAARRKCDFLEQWAPANAQVVWGRAEEQEPDVYGVALAKALAQPASAVEWCLPLGRPGGRLVLWSREPAGEDLAAAAAALEGEVLDPECPGVLVVGKLGATPERFPRRPGMAAKRPLSALRSDRPRR
jgi:16S rRNA (guanine527-N7)-methyltransferase